MVSLTPLPLGALRGGREGERRVLISSEYRPRSVTKLPPLLFCCSVLRVHAILSAELTKTTPCKGVVSRELLELELRALAVDRESIEDKLGLMLSSFAGPSSLASAFCTNVKRCVYHNLKTCGLFQDKDTCGRKVHVCFWVRTNNKAIVRVEHTPGLRY